MTPGPGIARTPLPKGFTSASVNCGVRKYRPDLGMIFSDRDCVAAGMFTENNCKAASVLFSQKILPSSHVRAIVTNSGQANAATGAKGREDNWKMALAAAHAAGCLPHQVLTASTGVIGQPLEIEKIQEGLLNLAERATPVAEPFAVSILTTDLVPKTVTTTVKLSGGDIRITGICKGSGMIHPNMATMLGYLLTDAAVPADMAKPLLAEATQVSFNMISVDGDTSTNDSVFFLANGASEVKVESADDMILFRKALVQVAQFLAQAIARDGEGATKLVEVNLHGAPDAELARRAARSIVLSPLIKSAIHGEDPNWGRILARLGAEKVPEECLSNMSLEIQDATLFAQGAPALFDRNEVRMRLKGDTVRIKVSLNSGAFDATAWGCDLSKKYVDINAEYCT
jgi:glutamate N-acetyltransferase/amino-acid N-acetyltransferase